MYSPGPPTGSNQLPMSPLRDIVNLLRRNKGRLNFLFAVGPASLPLGPADGCGETDRRSAELTEALPHRSSQPARFSTLSPSESMAYSSYVLPGNEASAHQLRKRARLRSGSA